MSDVRFPDQRACVFSLDDAYVLPFKVLVHSLVRTASLPQGTPIFILHDSALSVGTISIVSNFLSSCGLSSEFLDVSSLLPSSLPVEDWHHVSKATFNRLFVADILPPSLSSAVYLDCDTVAVGSLDQLFTYQLTAPVAAVDHCSPFNQLRLWGSCGGQYFQAGVLIVDLKAWRDMRYSEIFLDIMAAERGKIRWWDQDVLNLAFRDNWNRLDGIYNVTSATADLFKSISLGRPRLIHYDGRNKPWNSLHPQNPLTAPWFDEYRRLFGYPFLLPTQCRFSVITLSLFAVPFVSPFLDSLRRILRFLSRLFANSR